MTEPPARFSDGLIAALPIVMGYAPIAFAFGVAATGQGLSWLEAVGLSLIVYAGAAQFLTLALLGSGAPLVVAVATLVAMNLRHLLYGPALMKRAGPGAPRRFALIWAFGLTDEVFGTALGELARGRRFSEGFMAGLALAAYAAWVGGTALGAWAGGGALAGWPAVQAAFGFLLPALFLALLLSILSRAQLPAMAVSMAVTTGFALTWPGAAGILAGMVAGALAGTLWKGRSDAG